MTAGEVQSDTARCGRCGGRVDGCAFCQDEGCGRPLCYRCVRILMRQQVAEPHGHGG